ncbi:MAG: DUF2397 domain-containing protein [Streptosporangiaceae bacterium]
MGTPDVDAWELAGFPGRLDVAAYLTADQHAAQYRVLVDVLLDAQEQSLTGVSRDELLASVRDRIATAADPATAERLTAPDSLDIDARMRALQHWGVVIRWQDKAKTEADFVRTRDRYQLTSEAADLHRWLRRKIDEDAVATSAAAFAPAVIADRLDDTLLALAERDHTSAARAWAQVRTTLKDMAEAASIWQSRMASALAGSPDEEKMCRLRETLVAYVTVWGAGVDTYSPRIRDAVCRLEQITDDDWRAMALAGVDPDAAEEIVQAITNSHQDAALTLGAWFRPGSGQAPRLRRQVRDAVTPLLRGSRALLATGGRVTRRSELLRIAAAIESAESDEDAWRVWCAATGLWGARHLAGTPAEPGAPARTSFWDAPPVPVDVTLRRRGTQSVKGRPAHVPNHRAARQAARQAAEVQRAAAERAEQAIAGRSGTYLAEWPAISSHAEAAIVWDLLTAVLRTEPDASGTRTALTGDDRWIVIAYPAPPARPSALLATPDGFLACENWRIEVSRA